MTELSFFEKLTRNLKLSKAGRVGMTLSYFDVIELLGELKALKLYADELESEIAVRDEELHNKAHELSRMKIAKDELQTRIDELEAVVERLIEVGGWAITGMTIATSYSSSGLKDLAEKRRDEWNTLIKRWKEREK